MINNKPMRFWLAVLAISTLAACNSNDDDDAVVVVAPPTTQVDAFTTQVQTDVKVSSDDTESKDIDAIVLATSEDAEPVAVN